MLAGCRCRRPPLRLRRPSRRGRHLWRSRPLQPGRSLHQLRQRPGSFIIHYEWILVIY